MKPDAPSHMSALDAAIVAEARFEPRLRIYVYARSMIGLTLSVIGLPLVPFWAVIGWFWWSRRYVATLRCVVTPRRLAIAQGVILRQDVLVPLDRLQDVSLIQGPLLEALGLQTLKFETGAQTDFVDPYRGFVRGAFGLAGLKLVGAIDAARLKDHVLEMRARLVESARDDAREIGDEDPPAMDEATAFAIPCGASRHACLKRPIPSATVSMSWSGRSHDDVHGHARRRRGA